MYLLCLILCFSHPPVLAIASRYLPSHPELHKLAMLFAKACRVTA
jgi:hypothetical protein